MKPFTYKEMLMLDRMSGLSVDPSGQYAVFNVRATDMEANKGVTTLWLKDLSKPAVPEVKLGISEGGASGATWSSDGKTIYFLSSRGEGETSRDCGRPTWQEQPPHKWSAVAIGSGSYRITPMVEGWCFGSRFSRNARATKLPAR